MDMFPVALYCHLPQKCYKKLCSKSEVTELLNDVQFNANVIENLFLVLKKSTFLPGTNMYMLTYSLQMYDCFVKV